MHRRYSPIKNPYPVTVTFEILIQIEDAPSNPIESKFSCTIHHVVQKIQAAQKKINSPALRNLVLTLTSWYSAHDTVVMMHQHANYGRFETFPKLQPAHSENRLDGRRQTHGQCDSSILHPSLSVTLSWKGVVVVGGGYKNIYQRTRYAQRKRTTTPQRKVTRR